MKFTNTMFILASSNGHLFQTVTDKWHMETLGEKGEGGTLCPKLRLVFSSDGVGVAVVSG